MNYLHTGYINYAKREWKTLTNIELQKIKNLEKKALYILKDKLKDKKEFYKNLTGNDKEEFDIELKKIYDLLYGIIKEREQLARQRTYDLLMYYVSLKNKIKKKQKDNLGV